MREVYIVGSGGSLKSRYDKMMTCAVLFKVILKVAEKSGAKMR